MEKVQSRMVVTLSEEFPVSNHRWRGGSFDTKFHAGREFASGPSGHGLARALYATYVSYLPSAQFAYAITQHADRVVSLLRCSRRLIQDSSVFLLRILA